MAEGGAIPRTQGERERVVAEGLRAQAESVRSVRRRVPECVRRITETVSLRLRSVREAEDTMERTVIEAGTVRTEAKRSFVESGRSFVVNRFLYVVMSAFVVHQGAVDNCCSFVLSVLLNIDILLQRSEVGRGAGSD